MRPTAAERSEASTPIPAWLERVAWNAAALTALAIMLLVLLGSLEWLDRWDPSSKSTHTRAVDARPIAVPTSAPIAAPIAVVAPPPPPRAG